MTFENDNMPTYRQFVFGFSLWLSIGVALGFTALSGIGAVIFVTSEVVAVFIVSIFGYYPPSIDELVQAGAGYVMLMFWALSFVVMIFVQNEKWIAMVRKPQQERPRQTPRPLASRNVEEVQRLTSQMAIGQRQYFPVFVHHCKALYLRLQRNKWKITKRALDFEVETVKVFPNIGEKYMGIVAEWNRLGFVDGYVTGEAREKWFLNEAGQVHFADMGRVSE